jgi:two-component system NarL family sensor kinase
MTNRISLRKGINILVKRCADLIKPPIRRFSLYISRQARKLPFYQKINNTRLSYEQNLLIISLVIIFGILLLGAKTYQNNLANQDTYRRVDHTRQVLYDAEQISAAVKDLELGVRGYVITGDYTFLGPFYSTRQTIFTRINNLKSLSKENQLQQNRLDTLKTRLQQKLAFLEKSIEIKKNAGTNAAETFITNNSGVNRIKYLDTIIDDLKVEETRNLTIRKEANTQSNEIFTRLNLFLVVLLILMVTAAFATLWHNTQTTKKAKILLENNKQLLQSIIDNTSSIIYVKDIFGRFTLVNTQFVKTYGFRSEEILGKTVFDFVTEANAMDYARNDAEVFEKRNLVEMEEEAMIDGKLRHYYSIKFPLINRNNEVYAIAGISTDITDIIIKQKLERHKEMVENTILAQENERKEIGIELHDNISQLLASAKLMLDTALHNVERKDERLEKARNDVFTAINETRKLSHSLVSPALEKHHITTAIEDLTKDLSLSDKMKVQVKFNSKNQLNALDEKLKLSIYRIVQEQTHNILKYSKAANVLIHLQIVNNFIRLKIIDDGVGFDPATKGRGIGLRNIAGRVEFYSGTMEVTSAPNEGCMLEVKFPYVNFQSAMS